MTEPIDWDTILILGAELGEQAALRAPDNEGPRVAAAAYGWLVLQELWSGSENGSVQRWRDDMPEVLSRYAERIGIERLR